MRQWYSTQNYLYTGTPVFLFTFEQQNQDLLGESSGPAFVISSSTTASRVAQAVIGEILEECRKLGQPSFEYTQELSLGNVSQLRAYLTPTSEALWIRPKPPPDGQTYLREIAFQLSSLSPCCIALLCMWYRMDSTL
ncbi:Hypothetical_protein [Hexamita inflata]|uniref:Hypothetical_protein n=1 Tax=Hexamita inflata TaxID=28002 RepID=A0AA86PN94_9EUKA|nr:Hypothetical protein HINF_LOCUS27998 [Hexamita inflata]